MKEEWQLAYELHGIFFGIAFLLLTVSYIRAMICASDTTPLFSEFHVHSAINAVLVMFTSSRAFVLLLHAYIKDEAVTSVLDFDKFLFNISFPCLIAAYTGIIYPCLKYLKDRAQSVFDIVLLQCYLFMIAEISEITIPFGQHISLYISFILMFLSFLCGVCALISYTKTIYTNSFDISNDGRKSAGISVEISEETKCETDAYHMNTWKGIDNIVTVSLSCIWIACVMIRMCIRSGILKTWGNDIGMDTWYSWLYASVLYLIELGSAAIMSHLVQRITLK